MYEPSRYVGRSAVQVEAFLKHVVSPILKRQSGTSGHEGGYQRIDGFYAEPEPAEAVRIL